MFIKIALLVIFFSVIVSIGVYNRKHVTDVNSFVLGGRSVGPWLTAFSYGTSYFSAVIFIGYAGQFGWRFGLASTWIGIGNALIGSLLAWVLLGRRTRLMTQHLDTATMPQFFEKRYGGKGLRIGAAFIIFIFLIPYTASLYNGLSRLFEMAFGIDYTICIIAMGVLTCVYVVAGGYMAAAMNDFIQGIIMLIGIVAVVIAVLKSNGGFTTAISSLALVAPDEGCVIKAPGIFTSFFGPDPKTLISVIILTSLGTWGLPQMVQKFYAIKNEQAISKGTIISTFFAIVVAGGCYFLGGFGRLYSDKIALGENGSVPYDSIIPKMLENLPDLLIGIVIMLVLSASMSTLSALVMTSSSTLTLDFIKGNIVKDMSQKKQVSIIRVLIAIFILISMGIAIYQYKEGASFIAQLMGISWGALAGAFLAPFIYGLYWKKATKAATWASFIFGTGIMILNMVHPIFSSPIVCGAVAMLAGLVIVPIVSLFTQPPKAEEVDKMFACYEQTVTVQAKEALGQATVNKD
ncbi:MAG: sodium/solute symporter [Clostridia bacterium]|nr:sodium/solute symporter [Clostridia bacterium]